MSASTPIHVAGRNLGSVRHICAFFHSKEEECKTLKDFIAEGVTRRDKCVHIVDARGRDRHRAALRHEGIEVEAAEAEGLLDLLCWEETYLMDGYFDQDRQLAVLEGILQEGIRQGFPLTRLVANMEWALEERSGVEQIVEYESRLNSILPNYPDPVICTYDLSRFSAGVVMAILRTHPMVIIGGMLQENPLYVPPDQFLKELQSRST